MKTPPVNTSTKPTNANQNRKPSTSPNRWVDVARLLPFAFIYNLVTIHLGLVFAGFLKDSPEISEQTINPAAAGAPFCSRGGCRGVQFCSSPWKLKACQNVHCRSENEHEERQKRTTRRSHIKHSFHEDRGWIKNIGSQRSEKGHS